MATSPVIEEISWGHMTVKNVGDGKDFKLYPGGGREWDWGETGTEHVPGIQPEDVHELLEHGARLIVLSRGMLHRLRVKDDTLTMLEARGVRTYVDGTQRAVKLYNDLATRGELVGGLFHSTC